MKQKCFSTRAFPKRSRSAQRLLLGTLAYKPKMYLYPLLLFHYYIYPCSTEVKAAPYQWWRSLRDTFKDHSIFVLQSPLTHGSQVSPEEDNSCRGSGIPLKPAVSLSPWEQLRDLLQVALHPWTHLVQPIESLELPDMSLFRAGIHTEQFS